jgi:hypothetical protein
LLRLIFIGIEDEFGLSSLAVNHSVGL